MSLHNPAVLMLLTGIATMLTCSGLLLHVMAVHRSLATLYRRRNEALLTGKLLVGLAMTLPAQYLTSLKAKNMSSG